MKGRFNRWTTPEIEHNKLTRWNWLVLHPEGLSLGKETDIGAFTLIQAQQGVTIEEGVQVGSHCSIYSVSTIDSKQGPVVLKRNCRIGSHTTVMPGVTIGENAVVGAQSFVNRNIPANSMAFGVPARVRKDSRSKSS